MSKAIQRSNKAIQRSNVVKDPSVKDSADPRYLSPFCVNLTANLISILGLPSFGAPAQVSGYLRITLCGFGPVVPYFSGTGMLADAGIPQYIGPQVGTTPLSVVLGLNFELTPPTTFYEIAVLDQNKNVIQCGNYIFNTTGIIDLINATQIIPPYNIPLSGLRYAKCTGAIPGNTYTAPGTVIAATYNGIMLVPNQPLPQKSYTATGAVIVLNFNTVSGDRGIDALCVV